MARTRNPIGNEDYNFFRCKRCHFPTNLSRDKLGPGTGITYTTLSRSTNEGTGPDLPVVRGGCPLCGSKNYVSGTRFGGK